MQDLVTEYKDCSDMCRRLGYGMKNSFVLYPKERFVVMSDDMLTFARKYEQRRRIFCRGNPYFFHLQTAEH